MCQLTTLCAGFALLIGHKAAYSADILIGAVQIWILLSLKEIRIYQRDVVNEKNMIGSIKQELISCFVTSLSFLKKAKKAVFLMFCNSLVGAVDVLLLFFLQCENRIPASGDNTIMIMEKVKDSMEIRVARSVMIV